jgi:hypothetical protein
MPLSALISLALVHRNRKHCSARNPPEPLPWGNAFPPPPQIPQRVWPRCSYSRSFLLWQSVLNACRPRLLLAARASALSSPAIGHGHVCSPSKDETTVGKSLEILFFFLDS